MKKIVVTVLVKDAGKQIKESPACASRSRSSDLYAS